MMAALLLTGASWRMVLQIRSLCALEGAQMMLRALGVTRVCCLWCFIVCKPCMIVVLLPCCCSCYSILTLLSCHLSQLIKSIGAILGPVLLGLCQVSGSWTETWAWQGLCFHFTGSIAGGCEVAKRSLHSLLCYIMQYGSLLSASVLIV